MKFHIPHMLQRSERPEAPGSDLGGAAEFAKGGPGSEAGVLKELKGAGFALRSRLKCHVFLSLGPLYFLGVYIMQ